MAALDNLLTKGLQAYGGSRKAVAVLETLSAPSNRPLDTLSASEVQAWLQNTGNSSFSDSFAELCVDGAMLSTLGSIGWRPERAAFKLQSSEDQQRLTEAIALNREGGVPSHALHFYGLPKQRVGTRVETGAEPSGGHGFHGGFVDHVVTMAHHAVLPGGDAEENVDIVVRVKVPMEDLPTSRCIMARVVGYTAMLAVELPEGCHSGDVFVVHTSKAHMDDLEAGGEATVDGLNVWAFKHLYTTPAPAVHPAKRVARMVARAMTGGKAGQPEARPPPAAEDRLRVVMLLLRCKILGKRWRRRALALAAAAGRARPASKVETSAIGVPMVDLNTSDVSGLKERRWSFTAPADGAPFARPPEPAVPDGAPGTAQTAVPAALLGVSAATTQAEAAALAATNGTLGTADALTGSADGWYYEPAYDSLDPGSDGQRQGPYTLEQLQQWVDGGHFSLEDTVYEGCDGPHITLGAAFTHHGLGDAAPAAAVAPVGDATDGWYYDNDDGSARHGPYTLEALQEWVDGGHFGLEDTVYNGYDGPCTTLRDAFASVQTVPVGAVEETPSRPVPVSISGAGVAPIRGSLAYATMYGGYTI
jgi:hypothetical protein